MGARKLYRVEQRCGDGHWTPSIDPRWGLDVSERVTAEQWMHDAVEYVRPLLDEQFRGEAVEMFRVTETEILELAYGENEGRFLLLYPDGRARFYRHDGNHGEESAAPFVELSRLSEYDRQRYAKWRLEQEGPWLSACLPP